MMAAEVDSPDSGKVKGIAMEFPMNDDCNDKVSSSPPRRLRERLEECHNRSPSTVEEIETKLHLADLRRQQFYESLSIKARPKCRSPSWSSSNEDDLGQRLEAKLQAAEQKRLSILENARMRLARLDQLRQAAKTGVAIRSEKKRKELNTKVELRVQKAEANRMLLLKAYWQRRATLKERSSHSILRRMNRENKYKERVRAAIYQKRIAAEKKRLGLLEAEKKRAHARVLQVLQVSNSVLKQREIERRQIKDKLEDRLQKARRQRAEYLRQRGRLGKPVHFNINKVHKQADFLSRKLARCWRRFRRQRKTTLALATAYDALQVNEKRMKSMPFEQLALLIESADTLQTVKALLERFESRIKVSRAVSASNNSPFDYDNIDHLLKRVASPNRKPRSKVTNKVGGTKETPMRNAAKLSRYQVRIVLCAYMILSHPDAVFNAQGEREDALAKNAENFVREFELLVKIILDGPMQSSDEESCPVTPTTPGRSTFRSQLMAFDQAWCAYLNCFVSWKVKDAKTLEEDLVRAACNLELSMMQTCKMSTEGDSVSLTHDMKAVQNQVNEDKKLLREKVKHLSGNEGIERMEFALADTRTKYFQAREKGSPPRSSITLTPLLSTGSSSFTPSPVAGLDEKDNRNQSIIERPTRVVRSLFKEESSPIKNLESSSDDKLIVENEMIVNEAVHEQHFALADKVDVSDEVQLGIKKIKETMEQAFWDGIIESMEQDEPNCDRVFELFIEVRDDLCEMAPQSWKQGIYDAIDVDILSQVLKHGNLDMPYLGKILDFALVTLRRLSAPAYDEEMKQTHQKLLNELMKISQSRNELNRSLIKGLRFVLEQIQVLKKEISKARIRMMEPLLKGPAGIEYLKNAFATHYGPPSDAFTSLPVTVQWFSSAWNYKDQEWNEHKDSLSALTNNVFLPSSSLRTGGSLVKSSESQAISFPPGNQQAHCNGERIDLAVRLGLLKLVSGVSGLTQEVLPETLKLNLSRLRAVQAKIQEVIVIATSVLIYRQILFTEQAIASPADMETALSNCIIRLSNLFKHVQDTGIEQIVDTIIGQEENNDNNIEKLRSRKMAMTRMLGKSLQAGDAIFEKVSRSIHLALKRVVLGGSGPQGCKLAEMVLRQVGAAGMTKMVVEVAEVLIVAATVSLSVHGPWYACLADNFK